VDAAERAVLRAGDAVTDMADVAAQDEQPSEACRKAVRAADVYTNHRGRLNDNHKASRIDGFPRQCRQPRDRPDGCAGPAAR